MIAKERIIRQIIADFKVKSYLEIGLCTGFNFAYQEVEHKVGVEPDYLQLRLELQDALGVFKGTSDEYFEQKPDKEKFDLIFIDGLHEAAQVEKDIINAWYSLKKDGLILLHDVHPPSRQHQEVPRIQESWTGDVWRAFVGFREWYPKIPSGTLVEKYGLGWIKKIPRTQVKEGFAVPPEQMSYEYLAEAIKDQDILGYQESLKAHKPE